MVYFLDMFQEIVESDLVLKSPNGVLLWILCNNSKLLYSCETTSISM